ncbi:hypothetical protein NP233_g11683 [Leucocoprinus birnbaumii]|uniref:Alpha-type protein kinase domain-containing protein n=1 Tax=Leucocoprinus birnbaumii TaxID=56174 RepID=A0AAD5YK58_9AGAR|nr:hypothetical protein NP233_g11683 [Leucocoprinus birnbaumii]
MMLYTNNHFMLCDLQGVLNESRALVLFDPQAHTSEKEATNRFYWDRGPCIFTMLAEEHKKHCENNFYCNALCLCDSRVQYTEQTDGSAFSGDEGAPDEELNEEDVVEIAQPHRASKPRPRMKRTGNLKDILNMTTVE